MGIMVAGTLASIMITVFESVMMVIFFDIFMERKSRRGKPVSSFVMVPVVATSTIMISFFIRDFYFKMAVIIIMYLIMTLLFYQAAPLARFFVAGVYYFILYLADITILIVVVQFAPALYTRLGEDPILFLLIGMVAKLVTYMIIVLVRQLWRPGTFRKTDKNPGWLVLFYPPIISVIVLITLSLNAQTQETNSNRILLLLSAVGLMFLAIVIFYLANAITERQRSIRENSLLKQKVALEMDNMATLSESIAGQRAMLHDFNNHIAALQGLLDAGNYKEAGEFARQISGGLERVAYRINTRNPMADAVLNQKYLLAKSKGIQLEISAGDLSGLPVRGDDLVAVLANVLDNAIEACEQLTQSPKQILVNTHYQKGHWLLSVENPVEWPIDIRDNGLKTTKADASYHGYGLRNVAAILKSYDGSYELFCDGESFRFTAIASPQASPVNPLQAVTA